MAPESSSRQRLPFEPGGKGSSKATAEQKSSAKSTSKSARTKQKAASPKQKTTSAAKRDQPADKSASAAIPEAVSSRMLRRMLTFSGIPTAMGIITFFVSYYLVVNQVVELPSYFVLLVTLGCFGLGVVGLTYGVLSASWDEDRPGSLVGLDEFRVNFGRMTSAWGTKSER
ncbi:PAM68 family protein [Nodosilinea sp. LEGE 07088]|uniref:PAM68 family protein n=1 Tax=Nodosilinea sp. LEGE 07088 TaxID=2777968 RepID=UPI00187F03A6|nr:PAM68 family protein [Nodosilinea sp. LEGE 07088]MBE9138726.1 PAM68 family protein [Nodosilinea sp. LEGE 07088]